MNHTNAIGSNWKDVRKELFTQEEIHKSDERVVSISKTIEEQKKEQQEKLEYKPPWHLPQRQMSFFNS